MENLFLFAQDIFKKQNFSQLIGAELTEFETGSAEIALLIEDKHKQQHSFVHVGVIKNNLQQHHLEKSKSRSS